MSDLNLAAAAKGHIVLIKTQPPLNSAEKAWHHIVCYTAVAHAYLISCCCRARLLSVQTAASSCNCSEYVHGLWPYLLRLHYKLFAQKVATHVISKTCMSSFGKTQKSRSNWLLVLQSSATDARAIGINSRRIQALPVQAHAKEVQQHGSDQHIWCS